MSQAYTRDMSSVENAQAKEPKSESASYDASRLDRNAFDALIHELLRSRSRDDTQPSVLIIGWFSKGSNDPSEKPVKFENDGTFFNQLRKEVRFIRGWREYVSLKSLCRFGLYECDVARGSHVKLNLSKVEENTLSYFFRAYKTSRWYPDNDVSNAWTLWVQKNLETNCAPIESRYSLELIYRWSPVRLSVVVLFPVVFSFGTGLVYMLKTGDVSTAWTISSYIVTAAGVVVALLAILGSLSEQ
ncbi:hypothetical protein EV356DRAFT_241065 [Viridothelium virens]|uniref:Transmembrane protein n=1 Tax=Viridothelium virens TaxID=1048519 RepID=A0A6A6H432_VIRVR|nr:hypothetical protein EV356DRAFT_241065 [Viridothelium virens]